MGLPPEGMEVIAEPFMDNPLVMIAPADSHLVKETNISLEYFANKQFVLEEAEQFIRLPN